MLDLPFPTFRFGGFIEWKQQKLFWGYQYSWGITNIHIIGFGLILPGIQVSIYFLEFEQFGYLIAEQCTIVEFFLAFPF